MSRRRLPIQEPGSDGRLNDQGGGYAGAAIAGVTPPASHTHPESDITGLVSDLAGKAAAVHAHAISDTTGLQTALDGKAATGHSHAISDTTGLQTALDGKASSTHNHTGVYANATHSHTISDVTSLQTTLDGKQAALSGTGFVKISGTTISYDNSSYSLSSHTHTGTYEPAITAGTSTQVWKGNKTWGSVAWSELTSVPSTFTPSTHSHAISDVTSLQTSLDAKAPLASPALTGTPTAPTAATADNSTAIATTAWVRAQGYGAAGSAAWGSITGTLANQTDLNNALAGKAASSHNQAWSTITSTPTTLSGYGITDAASSTHNHSGVYAPVSHTHVISDVTGLQTALDGKQTALSGTGFVKISGTTVSYDNSTYSLSSHTHTGTYEPVLGFTPVNKAGDSGVGAISLTGLTASAGVHVTGDSANDGSMSKSAAAGLKFRSITGSSYDAALMNPGATAYIWSVPTGTNNFTMHGLVGVVAAYSASTMLNVGGGSKVPNTASLYQYGVGVDVCGNTSGTSGVTGAFFRARSDASAYTTAYLMGARIIAPVIGSGSTVTTTYGLYIEAQTGGGTNYAIYTNGGLVRFGDAVSVAGTISSTSTISTTGTLTAGNGTVTAVMSYGATYGVIGVTTAHDLHIRTNNIARLSFTSDGAASFNGNSVSVGDLSSVGSVVTNPTGDGNSGGFGFSTSTNNSSPAYGMAGRLTAGTGFGTHGAVSGDYATYFRMIGGTNRGWIWQSSAGNVASLSAPKGILNLGLATDRNIRIDPATGLFTIRTPASGYAVAYAFNAPDDTTLAGGFGLYGTSGGASYHYIGPDYANPLFKITTTGTATITGGLTIGDLTGYAFGGGASLDAVVYGSGASKYVDIWTNSVRRMRWDSAGLGSLYHDLDVGSLSSNTYTLRVHGNATTDFVGIGANASGGRIQAYTSGFAGATTLAIQPAGGSTTFGGGTGAVSMGALTATQVEATAGSFGAGRLYRSATYGTTLAGYTGSSWDLSLVAANGNPVLTVPTGTSNATFAGSVTGITEATNDNSTKFATTAWVRAQGYGAAGSASWGNITGTLASQTDLQNALNAKAPLVSPSFTTPSLGVATGTSFNSITGLASVAPLIDGTAAVGTSTLVARQDHVHPTDTTRQAALNGTGFVKISGTTISYDNSTYSLSTHDHSGTYQPLDADLTAIAALAGTSGFLKKTAADTWSLDTSTYLTGTKVDSFNTRTGAVTLTSSDVTTALTFTPATSTHNHSGTYEPALGNPGGNGYALVSTTGGVRSWALMQPALSGTGFVKISGSTISYDNATYSTTAHDHAGVYSPTTHDHAGVYSLVGHNHTGTYAASSHTHPISDVISLQTTLNGKATLDGTANFSTLTVGGNSVIHSGNIGSQTVSQATWAGNGCPVGTVMMYAGTTAPSGWTFCDGRELGRGAYSALYAVVGTTYGSGDGSTTFNVPDMRARVPLGGTFGSAGPADSRGETKTVAIGSTTGEYNHILTQSEMPNHNHTGGYIQGGTANNGSYVGGMTGSVNTGFTGGSSAHNTMQPSLALNFIIRHDI